MGKLSRDKGATYERTIAKQYQKVGYPRARRKLSQYQQTDGIDIENVAPFAPQCKCGKSIQWIKAYQEAKGSCNPEIDYPVAHIRVDNQGSYVLLSESDWFELVKLLVDHGIFRDDGPKENFCR